MEFRAHVTVTGATSEVKQRKENERAKELLFQAFQLLSKEDASIIKDAEEFLKGVS